MRAALLMAMAGLLAGSAAAQPMDMTINVGTDDRGGICRVYLPGGDMELQISVRASDGNTAVNVEKIPAEWTEGGESKSVPITLTFDNGQRFTTSDGAYRAGMRYRVSGYWNNMADGQKILPLLRGGQTILASFDGKKAGPFTIQAHSTNIKNYAFNFMQRCLSQAGSPVKL